MNVLSNIATIGPPYQRASQNSATKPRVGYRLKAVARRTPSRMATITFLSTFGFGCPCAKTAAGSTRRSTPSTIENRSRSPRDLPIEREAEAPLHLEYAMQGRGERPRWFSDIDNRVLLERRTKRLRQRVKDQAAELRLLRWEQRAGWLAVAPYGGRLCRAVASRSRPAWWPAPTRSRPAHWRSREGCRSV
jgi:hypothetical protein